MGCTADILPIFDPVFNYIQLLLSFTGFNHHKSKSMIFYSKENEMGFFRPHPAPALVLVHNSGLMVQQSWKDEKTAFLTVVSDFRRSSKKERRQLQHLILEFQ